MKSGSSVSPLEFWGGIECTLNRVGDDYFDQLQRSGHNDRPEDLEHIAELGIKTLRYPALWEKAHRPHNESYNWTWADGRLGRLRSLNITPVVGFLHHGSGPPTVDLMNPAMPTGLENYAARFAERFPWVQFYTPVNEPLTTARFSGLYGHWFPHRRDDLSFATACINQYRATVRAMKAIRQIRPDAMLIQTEDPGRTFSSPSLAYQADFENARRWLTFDMLSGLVDRHHPMGQYLLWAGISDTDLLWFQDNPCPPDILGINYYVTSERFLDCRYRRHPLETHGGNHRHRYADVAAVRVRQEGLAGIRALLTDAWERYKRPLAITEAHLHCGREDQLRWLWEIWREAQAARECGVDVRAVTAWSLLGAFDWDSLVTQSRGHYESGAFDVRGPRPRPTAVAQLIRQLSSGKPPDHPLLAQPGWWHRPLRLSPPPKKIPADSVFAVAGQPLVITGAGGRLGRSFARICQIRGIPCQLLTRADLDIADKAAVQAMVDRIQPWAIINAAGYARINAAERNEEVCRRENIAGPVILAETCRSAGFPFVTFSSDLVFDGRQRTPYAESDSVNPLGVYGRSKAECERRVLAKYPEAMVIRTSAFFSPWDNRNFVTLCRSVLNSRQPCDVVDGVVSPTYLPDLVHTCLDLLIDRAAGVWHLAGGGEISWAELIGEIACRAGFEQKSVSLQINLSAPIAHRPAYSALRSERGLLLPDWRDGLDRYFKESPAVVLPVQQES